MNGPMNGLMNGHFGIQPKYLGIQPRNPRIQYKYLGIQSKYIGIHPTQFREYLLWISDGVPWSFAASQSRSK